jgi:hypothetical protein
MGTRWYFDAKKTVESSVTLSIFRLNEWGLLKGWHHRLVTWTRTYALGNTTENSADLEIDAEADEPYARLRYTITRYRDNSTEPYDYRIPLAKTACNLGGMRYWFCCPQCGRRVGKIYRKPMGELFVCRVCNNLSYESRNECRFGRRGGAFYFMVAERKADKLRENAKRKTWRGRPTRKMRRILHFEQLSDITPEQYDDAMRFLYRKPPKGRV